MVLICAFDPGGANGTGWAHILVNGDMIVEAHAGSTASATPDDLAAAFGRFLQMASDTGAELHVGYEKFTLNPHQARQQAGSDMPASQVIGMLRMLAHLAGGSLVPLGTNAKKPGRLAAPPEVLAARERARNEHQRDALDLASFMLRAYRVEQIESAKEAPCQ